MIIKQQTRMLRKPVSITFGNILNASWVGKDKVSKVLGQKR